MDVLVTLEAEEPTIVTTLAVDQTVTIAGSKCVTSTSGDKKPKVQKKLLAPKEKVVQAAKRLDRHASLKLKQS
jgi:hypothetical protein